MNRAIRIATGIITPPLIGSLLFIFYKIPVILNKRAGHGILDQVTSALDEIAMVVIVAFVLVGLQSIACSIFVEFVLKPKKLRRGYFILTCIGLGSLSGVVPGVFVGWHLELLIIGPVVGLIVGQLIYSQGT